MNYFRVQFLGHHSLEVKILLKFFFCVYYKDAIDNGVTWKGINDDRIVISEWTVSLRMLKIELLLRVQ